MAVGDGNGWVRCRCGHRHWGRHGAAGLVLVRGPGTCAAAPAPVPGAAGSGRAVPGAGAPGPGGSPPVAPEVLLQLRAGWTHEGGTWGVPGGARDSHEDEAVAALREAAEEAAVDPAGVRVVGRLLGTDHGDWHYTYVLGLAGPSVRALATTAESDAVRWVALADVPLLPLHPGLAAAWPDLTARVADLAG